MAELTPIPSTQRPSESGYQPVSGYAVAAGVITVFFAATLIALTISAIAGGRMALTWEVLALPIAGVILAAIGRSHIRNSEGTRTGGRVVATSWWVCVLGGAGFAAYLYANSLVLEKESGKFADDMLKELQASRFQDAFENRFVPPEERGKAGSNAAPDAFEAAYGSSGYQVYRNHDLIRLYARNGKAVTFERIGSKDVAQESTGLQAVHVYRLVCPEGTYEIQVKLTTAESKKSNKQQWYIPAQPSMGISPLAISDQSQYGRAVMELEREGEAYARAWLANLSSGRQLLAQLMTMPRSHQTPISEALNHLAIFAGGPVASIPPSAAQMPPDRATAWADRVRAIGKNERRIASIDDLPFEDLDGIGFFRRDDVNSPFPEEKKNLLRDLWRTPHMIPVNPRVTGVDGSIAPLTTIDLKPDKIVVVVAADLFLGGQVHFVRCFIGVECTDPTLLAAVNAARDRGMQSKDDGSLTLATMPPRDWRIAWLRTDMETRARQSHQEVQGLQSDNRDVRCV